MVNGLIEAIEIAISKKINNMHTCFPAKIIAVNAEKCTVDVEPVMNVYLSTGQKVQYPILYNVMLFMPKVSNLNIGIAMPVNVGDYCLVLCAENSLENFRTIEESKGENFNYFNEKFSMNNAIAIVGLYPADKQLGEAITENAVIIYNGDTKIEVKESGVSVIGNLNVDGNITATGTIG